MLIAAIRHIPLESIEPPVKMYFKVGQQALKCGLQNVNMGIKDSFIEHTLNLYILLIKLNDKH